MGLLLPRQSHSSMAKVLIVLAWAGLATCAPQRFRTGGQSSSDIVNTVLSRLDIQGAVASALRGQGAGAVSTFSSPAVVATYGRPAVAAVSRPAVTTVSRPAITNFQLPRPINSVTTVTRPVSVSFTSQGRGSISGNSDSVVNSVLAALYPQIQRAVANALSSSRTSSLTSIGSNSINKQSSFSNVVKSSSGLDESSLVQQIISVLTPSISQSVSAALAGQTVNQQTFTSNFVSTTQSLDRNSIAMKVMDALEPTIAAQVSSTIESLRATQIAQLQQQNAVTQTQVEGLGQQIVVSVTPTIRSAVRTALESQASARISVLASRTTQIDQASLVKQIMSVLRPQVISAVNDAISAQEAEEARRLAILEQQRQAALREQQRKEAALREQQRQAALRQQQRQAALLEQQRQAALLEQQRLEAERQAALQASQSSGDLSSLFGSGHEVIQEVPGQTLVEYHIGVGNPTNIGFTPSNLLSSRGSRPTYG